MYSLHSKLSQAFKYAFKSVKFTTAICHWILRFLLLVAMELEWGALPVRYLGIPLICGKLRMEDCQKLRKEDCQPLIDKITSRIKSWTSKFLTFAGRLQLFDSVINSMINHWMSVFLLPKSVIKAVEKLFCSFLWSGVSDSSFCAKVAWKKDCIPKIEGGLGLKDLTLWNKSNKTDLVAL